jgi:hypothetical protein
LQARRKEIFAPSSKLSANDPSLLLDRPPSASPPTVITSTRRYKSPAWHQAWHLPFASSPRVNSCQAVSLSITRWRGGAVAFGEELVELPTLHHGLANNLLALGVERVA